MKLVVLGLSITSSWGNGHATTYRALLREFAARGHEVLFLERDVPWYRENRDLPDPDFCCTELYTDLEDLKHRFETELRECDWAIVGSYVPEGVPVGEWVVRTARRTAFYDIDTPVTLAKLARCDFEYLTPDLIGKYRLYLSFSGGPTLDRLEEMGSPRARPLYCSVDPNLYFPELTEPQWALSYLGTYSDDRQPTLNALLLEPAQMLPDENFCVAGPQYPESIVWPENVHHIHHLPPAEHRAFYNASRWTLNVTRADMIAAGWSPSVRLFEAAACGTPILSDYWPGLGDFFTFGQEICVASNSREAHAILRETSDEARRQLGTAAREKVLRQHTAAHRAAELEAYLTN